MSNPAISRYSRRGGLACARLHGQAFYQAIGRKGGQARPEPRQPEGQWHWIARARRRAGATQAWLASMLGVTRETVSSWERGRSLSWQARRVEIERVLAGEEVPA